MMWWNDFILTILLMLYKLIVCEFYVMEIAFINYDFLFSYYFCLQNACQDVSVFFSKVRILEV